MLQIVIKDVKLFLFVWFLRGLPNLSFVLKSLSMGSKVLASDVLVLVLKGTCSNEKIKCGT